MACRNMEKCAAAQTEIVDETFNKKVVCRKLDLASMKSIREFADRINKGNGIKTFSIFTFTCIKFGKLI